MKNSLFKKFHDILYHPCVLDHTNAPIQKLNSFPNAITLTDTLAGHTVMYDVTGQAKSSDLYVRVHQH